MDPSPAFSSNSADYFGNADVLFTLQEPHQELTVEATAKLRSWPGVGPSLTKRRPGSKPLTC